MRNSLCETFHGRDLIPTHVLVVGTKFNLCLIVCVGVSFGICIKKKNLCGCIGLILPIIVISVSMGDYIQLVSLLAVPCVLICEKADKIYIDKKYRIVWRVFYPFQKGVLACLR